MVKQSWDGPAYGSELSKFAFKLRRLKEDSKVWNRNVFGNVFQNVRNAEDDVLAREHDLEVNNCDENLRKLRDAKVMYQQTLLQEETFWRQKSRVKWLAEGEKNTKFFHLTVMQRKRRSHIRRIK